MISETFNNGVVSLRAAANRGRTMARSNMAINPQMLTGEWAASTWPSPSRRLPVRDAAAADEVLAEMEADASKNDVPIVGPAVARVLYQLATISGAKKIFGMDRPSAIHPGGRAPWWTADAWFTRTADQKRADKARRYFVSSGRQPADHDSRGGRASNFFRRKRNNTTLSSTISIRPTTRVSFVWRFRG